MEVNGGWGFPDTILSLSLEKIYYVISPAVFPLPPEVRLYYTEVSNSRILTGIRELSDPYDIPGILKETDLGGNIKGIMFAAYRKPLKNTTPLYSFRRNSTMGSILFLSENHNETGNWISKYDSSYNIISPIFFIDCNCSGFAKKDNFCYVTTESKETINQCTESIIPNGSNIHSLTTPDTKGVPFKKVDDMFEPLFITSTVLFVTAFIGIFFLRK